MTLTFAQQQIAWRMTPVQAKEMGDKLFMAGANAEALGKAME